MSIRLEGMDQLLRQVQQMGRNVDNRLKKRALEEGAEVLKEEAQQIVRVRSGTLHDNIIVSDIQGDDIHIGPDQQGTAFYGHILEFGRKPGKSNGYKYPGMPPYPFLGPAYENKKEAAQQKMAEIVKGKSGI